MSNALLAANAVPGGLWSGAHVVLPRGLGLAVVRGVDGDRAYCARTALNRPSWHLVESLRRLHLDTSDDTTLMNLVQALAAAVSMPVGPLNPCGASVAEDQLVLTVTGHRHVVGDFTETVRAARAAGLSERDVVAACVVEACRDLTKVVGG